MNPFIYLTPTDRAHFRTAITFLENRLSERSTVEWALDLGRTDLVRRLAVKYLLDMPDGRGLKEPWKSAWALIEESWGASNGEELEEKHYAVGARVKAGERTGSLIADIVSLVQPSVRVGKLTSLHATFGRVQRKPRAVGDLLYARLGSGRVFDPAELYLSSVGEWQFLVELMTDLSAAVTKGLFIGRRLGWDGGASLWALGDLRRVYFVRPEDRKNEEHEPDEFREGIAPATKLLYAVFERAAEINLAEAVAEAVRWRMTRSPIHLRLWAAAARDIRFASRGEVGELLASAEPDVFWGVHHYPELVELRARRFGEFDPAHQATILQRIRRGPKLEWLRTATREARQNARTYWIARELRRLEIAEQELPAADKAFLVAELPRFDELQAMNRIDHDFLGSAKARWVGSEPDDKYDLVSGVTRLDALERALKADGRIEDDNRSAAAWISGEKSEASIRNVSRLIEDFEDVVRANHALDYPRTLDKFGWHHLPLNLSNDDARANQYRDEVRRVLDVLGSAPERAVAEAIEGLSTWVEHAASIAGDDSSLRKLWFRLWPLAAKATNAQQADAAEPSLNVVVRQDEKSEPEDLDTLNTAAGKLVGAFLRLCPNLSEVPRPFANPDLERMRETLFGAGGRAGLIARHRATEQLAWFFHADREWTIASLLHPLAADDGRSVVLWRALARRIHFNPILQFIGEEMARRVLDPRLGRDSRQSLCFSLIVEMLHSFLEKRRPAVGGAAIQQILRSISDEMRAYAAGIPHDYVRGMLRPAESQRWTREQLFDLAVQPFLAQVWPQERSLVTPGVARSLADLPSEVGERFAEAVEAISGFLIPFDCWSLIDYGLYGEDGGSPKIERVDSPRKAEALLRLLDLTISGQDGAVVPSDLGDALQQVERVNSKLAKTRQFRRLAAMLRK